MVKNTLTVGRIEKDLFWIISRQGVLDRQNIPYEEVVRRSSDLGHSEALSDVLKKDLFWIISRQGEAWISINTCIWINWTAALQS